MSRSRSMNSSRSGVREEAGKGKGAALHADSWDLCARRGSDEGVGALEVGGGTWATVTLQTQGQWHLLTLVWWDSRSLLRLQPARGRPGRQVGRRTAWWGGCGTSEVCGGLIECSNRRNSCARLSCSHLPDGPKVIKVA